jgi:hypothetical protein
MRRTEAKWTVLEDVKKKKRQERKLWVKQKRRLGKMKEEMTKPRKKYLKW